MPQEVALLETNDPAVLVSILIAARKAGHRVLEEVARRELDNRHHIKVRFARDKAVSNEP